MARLIVVEGPDLGLEFEIERGGGSPRVYVIGRDPRADIRLRDEAVSREHCRIEATPSGWRIVDLGSRNRTFLNGEPIESFRLRDGDRIALGDTELRFEDDEAAVDAASGSTIIKEFRPQAEAASHPAGEDRYGPDRLAALARELARHPRQASLIECALDRLRAALGAERTALLARRGTAWRTRAALPEAKGALAPDLEVLERVRSRGGAVACSWGESASRSALVALVPLKSSEPLVFYAERPPQADPFAEPELRFAGEAVEILAASLDRLEEEERLREENRNLLRTLTEHSRIVGRSPRIRKVLEFIERAAPVDMNVLIQGETGTGKELVAQAIHYAGPRRGGPFIAINCAALPETLAESELFGHERGAFTGAAARRKGKFELASGGTVFLDEVAELSPACQGKLLRLLEERRVVRVGGTEPIEVDVRVLAATNKDLWAAVERKEFREDLYYRLAVLTVELPPLRERIEDIPELAEYFLARLALPGPPRRLSKAALTRLQAYCWPGNIRQLRNVLESAAVLCRGEEIRPEDLVLPEPQRPPGGAGDSWEPITLQELERRHIQRVLEFTGGNKTRAAEILGIERCTLYSRLKAHEKRRRAQGSEK